VERLEQEALTVSRKIKVNSVCSPVVIPKAFDDKFFPCQSRFVTTCSPIGSQKVRVFQTLLVNLSELSDALVPSDCINHLKEQRRMKYNLIFVSSVIPRRELTAVDDLVGAMRS